MPIYMIRLSYIFYVFTSYHIIRCWLIRRCIHNRRDIIRCFNSGRWNANQVPMKV